MVITYKINLIDAVNKPRKIPDEIKYRDLTEFINKFWGETRPNYRHNKPINRNSFGKVEPKERKSIFNKPENQDDKTKLLLNELTCKISENNSKEILRQFKEIEFDQIEDKYMIMKSFHHSLITCIRYINLFIAKIDKY